MKNDDWLANAYSNFNFLTWSLTPKPLKKAIAIEILDPTISILIADEPTSGLDAASAQVFAILQLVIYLTYLDMQKYNTSYKTLGKTYHHQSTNHNIEKTSHH